MSSDHLLRPVLELIGFDDDGQDFFRKAFNLAISKWLKNKNSRHRVMPAAGYGVPTRG